MSQAIPKLILAAALAWSPACAVAQEAPAGLAPFVQALWPDAQAKGVSRKTFDAAFAGLTSDPRVAAITRRQPEYNSAVGTYVNAIASPARIAGIAARATQWKQTLDAIEQQYGVDRWIILSIWGIETSFGANTGGFDVIRSLATLAAIGYRTAYFREELLAALQILQDGHVAREKMTGSWAGAMGQPQFMPSNFSALAVDFDRNGRKDIWTSVPDVLGSIGNYFRHHGWKEGIGLGLRGHDPARFRLPPEPRHVRRLGKARRHAGGRKAITRKRRRDPAVSERRRGAGISGDGELLRDQALQHFRLVRARGRPVDRIARAASTRSARPGRRMIASSRASSAWRYSAGCRRSVTR